jgi:hypothetical protein
MVCHLILEFFTFFSSESRTFTFTELQKQIQAGIKFTVHSREKQIEQLIGLGRAAHESAERNGRC